MPKVSVVIPIYGVEQYIEQCARSLFEQTLDDVEYLFIDDCTPDKSIEVLELVLTEYPLRINQVKILHNIQNLGQIGTRRRGISHATGEYVIHCDSDDWVEPNWLELLYLVAFDNNADVVWCDYTRYYNDGRRVYWANAALETVEDCMIRLMIGPKWGTLWSNLVKREIVQSSKIVWPTWNYCEDLSLVSQYISLSKKSEICNKISL